MTTTTVVQTSSDVACPFCGLMCDDLVVTTNAQGQVLDCINACERGREGFRLACDTSPELTCCIEGVSATIEDAVDAAAQLMVAARMPVVGGLATDVAGVREAVQLAERSDAVLDHSGSRALLRNQRVMQRSGWFTTTLTEIRNRADLVVLIGDGISERFPRLLERIIFPDQSMHEERLTSRQLISLGEAAVPASDALQARGIRSTQIDHVQVKPDALMGFVNAVRHALKTGDSIHSNSAGTESQSQAQELAQQISASQYTVFVWSAGLLPEPSADLVIDSVCQLINLRNETGRCAGFPIAGNDGDITANQVCTWQTGFPLRTGFTQGLPVHDPLVYGLSELIDTQQLDLLLWISSLMPDMTMPRITCPSIVLGHPLSEDRHTADVFIPVETPGVGARGLMVRADVVVSLPLSAVRAPRLPGVAQVLKQLTALVTESIDRQKSETTQ